MAFGEIESALILIKGVWLEIHIDPDHDAEPGDYDCYDNADKAAFTAGHWRFVNVTVVLRDHPSLRECLGAVEWGSMPTTDVGMSAIVAEHVPDLMAELRSELVTLLNQWEV